MASSTNTGKQVKLNSPAGNRTLVSRVTCGDTLQYTTEDYLCWTGCEFINSSWFWSIVIDAILYEHRKISWTPRQGNEPWSPCVTGGDTHHYTTEDCICWAGCEFINSLWFWSIVIDGILYEYRKISWTPRQGNEPWSPCVTGGDTHHYTTEDCIC